MNALKEALLFQQPIGLCPKADSRLSRLHYSLLSTEILVGVGGKKA